MKIKRYKKVQKHMSIYVTHFGFYSPYQVIVDGTLCHQALESKVNLREQLPKYLNEEVKFLTTPCSIIETENIGRLLNGALKILKTFPVHQCGHFKHPIPGAQCIKEMVLTGRYIIGTQDKDLQHELQNIPGVPVLYLHQSAPTLVRPSPATQEEVRVKMQTSTDLTEFQSTTIQALKLQMLGKETEKKFRKKKSNNPNPLSMKKKSKKAVQTNELKGKSRKRQRKKLPKHVLEQLGNK